MFWRETGTNDDEDDVEAREGACSIETAMAGRGCRGESDGQEAVTLFLCVRGRDQAGWVNQRRRRGNCSGRARPARGSRVVQSAVQRGLLVGLI